MQAARDVRTPTDDGPRNDFKPTHFVTIQITDKETIKNLRAEQQDFLARYPRYRGSVIPPQHFHVTLTVLKLENTDHTKTCIAAMEKAKIEIEKLARKAGQLRFQGLGSFSPKVIYAKVEFSKDFMELVDLIRNAVAATGIKVEFKPLNAHVTLFKVSYDTYKEMGVYMYKDKLILASHFDPDPYFGSQDIDNIQVCEMRAPIDDFYNTIYKLSIDHSK